MPSLPSALASQAKEAAAAGGSFSALEPGVYTGRLAKVDAKNASTGSAMWALEFDTIQKASGEKCPGRQWTNLVLVENAMWKVGQFFAAFGVPESTSTDELINYRVRLQIGKRVIQQGSRAGQEGNDINGFVPLVEDDEGFEAVKKLAAKLSGGSKPAAKAAPAKAAPAKAAAPAAAAAEDEAPDDAPANAPDDDSGVDF